MLKILRTTFLALLLLTGSLHSADWSKTSLSLLSGKNYKLGQESREILTFEHANKWLYGDNFFFFDVTNPTRDSTAVYGEWNPRLSFSKMSQRTFKWGIISDLLLSAQLEFGSGNVRTYLYGLGIDLDLPGFTFFKMNLLVRDKPGLKGKTLQLTPSWLYPFTIGSLKMSLGGFIDWAGSQGSAHNNLFIVPQLLVDIGDLWDDPDRLFAGIEYSYWKNKFGVKETNESVVQGMAKWVF